MEEKRGLGMTRRQVLRAGALAAAGLGLGGVLAACASKDAGDQKAAAPPAAPAAPKPSDDVDTGTGWPVTKKPVKLVAYMFLGAKKEGIYRQAAAELKRVHPNLDVEFTFDPRIWDQLRPKMVAGEPPDLSYYGWGIDMAAAVDDDQVVTLDKALDAPAYEQPNVKWRDTFINGSLRLGTFDNKTYLLPQQVSAYGIWYDKKTFAENNWQLPKTWEEFLALCETIKKSGKMAPITYTGKYPQYWGSGFIDPLIYKLGGPELVKRIDNLEPGAWLDPAVVRAAEMTHELIDKGYIMDGSKALSHTESQMAWLQRKAAFIPVGSWLESEMKGNIPADFEMRVIPVPSPAGAKMDSTAIKMQTSVDFAVFVKSKSQNEAIEYLRVLLSKKFAKIYAEELSIISVVKGGAEGAKVSDTYKSIEELITKASSTFPLAITQLYQPFATEYTNAIGKLMDKAITPKAFTETVEKEADKIRKDPGVRKRKV